VCRDGDGTLSTSLWFLRMSANREPLVDHLSIQVERPHLLVVMFLDDDSNDLSSADNRAVVEVIEVLHVIHLHLLVSLVISLRQSGIDYKRTPKPPYVPALIERTGPAHREEVDSFSPGQFERSWCCLQLEGVLGVVSEVLEPPPQGNEMAGQHVAYFISTIRPLSTLEANDVQVAGNVVANRQSRGGSIEVHRTNLAPQEQRSVASKECSWGGSPGRPKIFSTMAITTQPTPASKTIATHKSGP
jgi:hypothetical protein